MPKLACTMFADIARMPPFASCLMRKATYLWSHSVQSQRQWMNRAGVSLVRDRRPAAAAQDEMDWPPFLI